MSTAISHEFRIVERFWKFFKRQLLYNHYYETFDSFRDACKALFGELDVFTLRLRALLTKNF